MGQVDRRAFMQKAGIAGVAAGAIWAAPSVLGSSTAFADGSCIYKGSLLWSTLTKGASEPNTSKVVTLVDHLPGYGSVTGVTVTMTVTPSTPNPGAGSGNNGGVRATVPYPGTNPGGLDGVASYYALSMNNGAQNRGYTVTFSFTNTATNAPLNVYNLQFTIIDIDRDTTTTNNYKDAVAISPAPTSTILGSNVIGGGTGTPGGTGTNPWTGKADAGIENASGDVAITYSGPISTTTITYWSDNSQTGKAGTGNDIQYVGVGDLTWCY